MPLPSSGTWSLTIRLDAVTATTDQAHKAEAITRIWKQMPRSCYKTWRRAYSSL